MAAKFYKKLSPSTKVVFDDNKTWVQFKSIDGLVGYYSTEQAGVQEQFQRFMDRAEYGIEEITAQEFNDEYLEKKNQPMVAPNGSGNNWREELGAGMRSRLGQDPVSRLGPAKVAAAVGVADRERGSLRAAPATAAPTQTATTTISEPPKEEKKREEFKPNIGSRTKPKPKDLL